MADGEACGHHAGDDYEGCHDGRPAGVDQFLETELKPQREQQDYDANLGPELDVDLGGDRGERLEVGAGQESGHDVAQDDGLFYPFEKQGDGGTEQQYEGEV